VVAGLGLELLQVGRRQRHALGDSPE
jgi:hypothetical protein